MSLKEKKQVESNSRKMSGNLPAAWRGRARFFYFASLPCRPFKGNPDQTPNRRVNRQNRHIFTLFQATSKQGFGTPWRADERERGPARGGDTTLPTIPSSRCPAFDTLQPVVTDISIDLFRSLELRTEYKLLFGHNRQKFPTVGISAVGNRPT